MHTGGHSHAPLQTHNVLMRPVHAQPTQPLPNRTHPLRRRKHDKGGKRVVGRHKREQKLSLGSAHGGAFPCTTPNPQRLHAAGACTASTTLPNRTHGLRGRKHDKGEKRMVGRHKREEKSSLGSAQGGAFPCTTPNPQRPHAAGACTASTTLAQPNSRTARDEA